ncbi:unnamed protein product [Effrenium voratum]|nr:unnamed protein product [Effrenium voratum]
MLQVTTRISFDILEHCDPEGLKDSSKNTWTNIAVTSALILTMVMAMLQVDAIAPISFTLEPYELIHLQHAYVSLCLASLCFNLICITVCVLNLSYVDPLTTTDAIKFFLANADTIGDPAILMAESFTFFVAAVVVWTLGCYGLTLGLLCLIVFIIITLSVANVWKNRSKFAPKEDMTWTQDPSLWRRELTTGGVMANRGNPKVAALMARFGKVVMDAQEAEKKKSQAKDGQVSANDLSESRL